MSNSSYHRLKLSTVPVPACTISRVARMQDSKTETIDNCTGQTESTAQESSSQNTSSEWSLLAYVFAPSLSQRAWGFLPGFFTHCFAHAVAQSARDAISYRKRRICKASNNDPYESILTYVLLSFLVLFSSETDTNKRHFRSYSFSYYH